MVCFRPTSPSIVSDLSFALMCIYSFCLLRAVGFKRLHWISIWLKSYWYSLLCSVIWNFNVFIFMRIMRIISNLYVATSIDFNNNSYSFSYQFSLLFWHTYNINNRFYPILVLVKVTNTSLSQSTKKENNLPHIANYSTGERR